MLDVITKVYDKNSKPKVKKATLNNFYIERADKYRGTLCYSYSRAEVTDKQNASLSYCYLTQEEIRSKTICKIYVKTWIKF